MDRLSSDELFENFGISSTPKEKSSIHTRFDDNETHNHMLDTTVNLASSGSSSSSDIDYDGCNDASKSRQDDDSGRGKSESEKLDVNIQQNAVQVDVNGLSGRLNFDSDRINNILERFGFQNVREMSRGQKIDNLIQKCEDLMAENEKIKQQLASSVQDLFIVDSLPGTENIECFNCGGNHSVSDCKEPLDQSRIKRKKMEKNRSKIDKETRNRRYAEEHSKFKPGVTSEQLRNALNLVAKDLPPWIYKMRRLGYPPGHLKDAFSEPSKMKMMDENGQLIKPKSGKDKGSYDFGKIISFAGFNEPVPDGVEDNFTPFDAPPFSNLQAKDVYIQNLQRELNGDTGSDNGPTTSAKARAKTTEISGAAENAHYDDMEIIVEDEIREDTAQNSLSTTIDDKNSPYIGSVEIVDEAIEDGEITDKIETEVEEKYSMKTPDRQPTTLKPSFSAQSLNVELGTPVSVRNARFFDEDDDDNEKSSTTKSQNGVSIVAADDNKPSLEAFSVGVNKFEYLEESLPCRGGGMANLKQILAKKRCKK
uniref:PSP proline-rich domain-containing protein n=1 Tax=Romanomermis culicivorax TaxID=13658 RepID=A0A915INQ6_ROMCU